MIRYQMRTKNIKEKIKQYFFTNPTIKIRVRQIERTLNLSLPSIIRYVRELEKEGILKKVDTSGVIFYTTNRSSKFFLIQKKLHNLNKIYESGLVDFLIKELSNPTIIIFGSFSRGEDIENSDIDIYIETPSKKKISVNNFERVLKRNIQLFIHRSIDDIKNKELANNIINGIVLNGFIKVFR